MRPNLQAALEIALAIGIGLAIAISTIYFNGCSPELPAHTYQSPEDRAKVFIRLFTDPNFAPMLRRINNARIDQMLKENQLEKLDRERALKSM